MFWASSCPSSGATTTAVAASGLPSGLGDSSAVGRGQVDHDQQHIHLSLSYINPTAWNMDYIKFWPGSFYICLLH